MRKLLTSAVLIGWAATTSVASAQATPNCGTQASPAVAVIRVMPDATVMPDVCEVYEGTEVRFVQEDDTTFSAVFAETPAKGGGKNFGGQSMGHHHGVGFVARDLPNNGGNPKPKKTYKFTVKTPGHEVDPSIIIWPR